MMTFSSKNGNGIYSCSYISLLHVQLRFFFSHRVSSMSNMQRIYSLFSLNSFTIDCSVQKIIAPKKKSSNTWFHGGLITSWSSILNITYNLLKLDRGNFVNKTNTWNIWNNISASTLTYDQTIWLLITFCRLPTLKIWYNFTCLLRLRFYYPFITQWIWIYHVINK